MHAFIFRLVQRLTGEGPVLSRNRHFHTFVSPEGQKALRIARQLRSIARDVAAAPDAVVVAPDDGASGRVRLEIPIPSGLRTAILDPAEWELLLRMPIVRASLGEPDEAPAPARPILRS